MTVLERIRGRVPLVVFLLLLVLVLMLVGFACACLGGDPMHQSDRGGAPLVWMPPVTDIWAALALLVAIAPLVVLVTGATGRASPIVTQRFLF